MGVHSFLKRTAASVDTPAPGRASLFVDSADAKPKVRDESGSIISLEGPRGPAGTGHTIEDELVALTARTKLSFQGAGVTATDDSAADRTIVTIPGGGGGGVTAALDDDFSVDRLANYVADQGSSKTGLVVTGGLLTVTDTNDHSFHHGTLTVVDAKHMLKVVPGASTAWLFYLAAKFVSDGNMLMLQAHGASGTNYTAYSQVAGAYTSLGTLAMPSAAGGQPHWIVLRHNGNHVAFEAWRTNPAYGNGMPFSRLDVILSGTAATTLGAGVAAAPGARISGGGSSNWKLDDWVVVNESAASRTAF